MKKEHGNEIPQTIDTPITFLDYFDLWDLSLALLIILVFGVILYSWWAMIGLLIINLGILPKIKKKSNRGVFLHYFYKKFGLTLPGLMNPGRNKKYSD